MNILALDLGSHLGWALTKRDGSIHGGAEALDRAKHGSHGARFLAFMAFLTSVRNVHGDIHAVYYEDVKQHSSTLAAHSFGGLLAIVQVWCVVNGKIPLYPLPVKTIKKVWTGNGNADKAKMIASAKQRGFNPVNDDHADALAILSMACAQEGRPFPSVQSKPDGALL